MNAQLGGNETILVIDDEPANLKLVDKLLRSSGFRHIELVGDPREVLDRYRASRPDLILLDLQMPHHDGFAVMEELKQLADPMLPPIIILTAQTDSNYVVRALTAGARDYVTKPFDRHELLMRVRNLLDAHLGHRMVHDQKEALEELVRDRTEELRETRLQIIRRLGRAAEYRDEETGNHILRMSHSSALLARTLGWNETDVDLMLNASPMHDLGKIGIPDAILLKPGRFEPEEWKIMQTHAAIGAELLAGDDSPLMRLAHDIALCHHEKWDGSGYPNGLAGEDIPMAGRICALADVFDALTSVRPYKRAWPVEEAIQFIRDNTGSHFDPVVAEAFHDQLPRILEIRERFSEPDEVVAQIPPPS